MAASRSAVLVVLRCSYQRILLQQVRISQARGYAKNYKQPKEESRAYGLFRRGVSALRRQFREEWLERERMKLEAEGAQAAEEIRMERLHEERAWEENKKELERMVKKRSVLTLFSAHIDLPGIRIDLETRQDPFLLWIHKASPL